MGTEVSTGYASMVLGPHAFDTIFRDGCIEVRTGAPPPTADEAAPGTLLGRITRDGGAWAPGVPDNGLRFQRAGRFVMKDPAHRWRFVGVAAGTAGWMRLCGNAEDDGAASFEHPRIDGRVGLTDATDDVQLWLPRLNITVGTEIEITQFWYAIPPLGV